MDTAAPDRQPPPALDTGGRAVPGAWIDYNGHMMDDAKRLSCLTSDALHPGSATAANELRLVHVGLATERVTTMPPGRFSAAEALASLQAALPVPGLADCRPGARPEKELVADYATSCA